MSENVEGTVRRRRSMMWLTLFLLVAMVFAKMSHRSSGGGVTRR